MQTCSRCNATSPDTASQCQNCQAQFPEFSTMHQALQRYRSNPRVQHVMVAVSESACPVCQKHQGYYQVEDAPALPIVGCSHPNGCRCFYQPILTEVYP